MWISIDTGSDEKNEFSWLILEGTRRLLSKSTIKGYVYYRGRFLHQDKEETVYLCFLISYLSKSQRRFSCLITSEMINFSEELERAALSVEAEKLPRKLNIHPFFDLCWQIDPV